MNYEEAMRAARKGLKVSPVGKPFFVYYTKDAESYRRVSINDHKFFSTFTDSDFYPSTYEVMMTWEIYDNSPFTKIKNWFKRATVSMKLSSYPA